MEIRTWPDGPGQVRQLPAGMRVEIGPRDGNEVFVAAIDGTLGRVPSDAVAAPEPPAQPAPADWMKELAERAGPVSKAMDASKSSDELLAAWREASRLARSAEPALNAALRGLESPDPVLDALTATVPWMLPVELDGWFAGGLDPGRWSAAALRTPEPVDDRLFTFLTAEFGSAAIAGWSPVITPTGPVHGCTNLGGRRHALGRVFRASAELTGVPEIAALRAAWIEALTAPPPLFPHCVRDDVPSVTPDMTAEALELVAVPGLTPEEHARIQAAIDSSFGREHP